MTVKKGLFIVFEGIDGAGKQTISKFTKEVIESKGFKVASFEYPNYDSVFGNIINQYLHNEIELKVVEEFFLYLVDILRDQKDVYRLLEEGYFVLSDRYLSSTVAFQCAKGFDYMKARSVINTMDVIIPDLTILLQITPKVALERKYKEKEILDRHEKDTILLKDVNSMYEKIVSENMLSRKWIKIDGSRDLEVVKNDIKNTIDNLFYE